jgi:hypothetical protein
MAYSPNIQLVYNEKAVEDLIEADCEHFLGLKFITRQFRTPVGIVDVIAKHPENSNVYYVIEVKRERLDAAAYVQVLRYAKWLNSEYSQYWKRLFIPILIGESLSSELTTLCEYFDKDDHDSILEHASVFYRLFAFNTKTGVSFKWNDKVQSNHVESLRYRLNPIERIQQDVFHLECELSRFQQARVADQKLSLIKSDSGSA